jgi:hypothetical protein
VFSQEVSLKFDDYDHPLHSRTKIHEYMIINKESLNPEANSIKTASMDLNLNDVILIDSPIQNPWKESYDLKTSYLTVNKMIIINGPRRAETSFL